MVAPCPSAELLEQLLLGRLPPETAEPLEEHVAGCALCAANLGLRPADDSLIEVMRQARAAGSAPDKAVVAAMIPWLKQLRPGESGAEVHGADSADTATLPAAASGKDTPAGAPVRGPFAFLAPPERPEEIGRLGPYSVLRPLDAGGMGMVFLAEDLRLQRQLALKVIKPELVARPELRERLLREAQAVAALEHDNVIAIFQAGEERGVPFLAMPLLRGESLEERLQRAGGPLPVEDILRIGREIAAGLAAAHERGLIHRDIKPGNIFLAVGGSAPTARVKILDFGLAHTRQGEQAQPAGIAGTPAYMAPEQATGQPTDARADLFSLGAVLYRLATGRAPFEADSTLQVLVRVTADAPVPPRTLNPCLPPALEQLILALLRKQPEERPGTAEEVRRALQALEEARRRSPWQRGWLAAGAAVLAAAGLVLWLALLRPLAPPPAVAEITFAYDEPDGRVALRPGDETERVVDLQRAKTLSLPAGDYELRAVGAPAKRRLWPQRLHVKPGEQRTVALRLLGEVASHRAHDQPVRGLAVCARPDGLLVLSVSEDRTLLAWRPDRGAAPQPHWHKESPLRCLALAPDGKTVATGSGGVGPRAVQAVRLWDIDTLKRRAGALTCRSQVNALAYAPDGKRLLSAENDGTLLLWDVRVRDVDAEQLKAHGGLGVFAVAFLPDGKRVLTAGGDGTISERSTADLAAVRTLTGHTGAVHGLAVLPGGTRAVSAGLDATIRLWDLATGRPTTWKAPAPLQSLALSPDGARLLTGDEAGGVRLWDLATQAQLVEFTGSAAVRAVAFTPDGRRGVSGGSDGVVRLWELPK